MNKFFFLSLCILAILSSCKFNPNVQGKGTDYMQGVWKQDSIAHQQDLITFTTHQFKFTCDSFYVTFHTRSKINYDADTCFNNGAWTEYAKGTYVTKGDTLSLTATYTHANFKQKISGCYHLGQYLEDFKIKEKSAAHLQLESLRNHAILSLTLKEKVTCVPQPLF